MKYLRLTYIIEPAGGAEKIRVTSLFFIAIIHVVALMATRFNVADVPLEAVRDEVQQNGNGGTPSRTLTEDSVQDTPPLQQPNPIFDKNQITITSESNFALYEVSALSLSLSPAAAIVAFLMLTPPCRMTSNKSLGCPPFYRP